LSPFCEIADWRPKTDYWDRGRVSRAEHADPWNELMVASLSDLALQHGLRSLGAIVIGRAGLDLYPEPDGTEIEAAEHFSSDVGGSAANIAVALARQAVRVALISPLSDDAVGRFVRATLDRHGVDTSRCRAVADGYRTSLALAETRAADCEVVIYRNGAADFQLAASDIDRDFIASASVLIVTGTALAVEPSRGATMQAIASARASQTFVVFDIDHRPYSWTSLEEAAAVYAEAARRSDAVIANDEEFAIIAGGGDALAAATALVGNGSSFAVFKRGDRGSVTITPGGNFDTDVYPVKVKKPFGAGDAFVGGLMAALLGGIQLRAAVARGSAAAALVVSRRGCASAMPTSEEVEVLLSQRHTSPGKSDAHPSL
jgi:5-dehydro-2-deoxygluconokinase